MPIEMKLWRVTDDDLRELSSSEPDTEWDLEGWIEEDSTILADDLLMIGRQVTSALGGTLDLLAIDAEGDLVVIELKRDKTPREVVAQLLHYAAWVSTLSWRQVGEIAEDYLRRPLEEAFEEQFEADLPEDVNTQHRMLIVAAALDDQSEAIVQ